MPEAFSYSRLKSLEDCPRKFHELSILKSVKEEPNENTDYGTEVHLAFANRLKKGTPLPLHLRHHEKLLASLAAAPGEHIVEQKVAINANYEPTGWFDKDVYCRVISDLTIINGSRAAMFDWKTGKMSDDFSQLRLAGAVIFLLAPELEQIDLAYVWLKNKQVTKERMLRGDCQTVWADLMPRLARYQAAFDQKSFPPRPNYLCKGWCPVKTCQYWEAKKKK